MDFWIVFDKTTGAEMSRGMGPEGYAAAQLTTLPTHVDLLTVSSAIHSSYPLDFDAVKALATNKINSEAEEVRKGFLTAGDGQLMTYQEKLDEARAYTADNTTKTVFIAAEAIARGMTIDEVAGEIISTYNNWKIIGSRIEAARMGAKTVIDGATNLAELAQATKVDWQEVVATIA